MERMKQALLVTLLMILPKAALAETGGVSSGGGGAFVCKVGGKIQSAELLELWDARENRGQNIPYTNEAVDLQIQRALTKLSSIDPAFAVQVTYDLEYVRAHRVDLPITRDIDKPVDAMNAYTKPNCPLQGMMYFDGETDPPSLSIKAEIFSKLLNRTNIAAAWMHEALYKSLRAMSGGTAIDSRGAQRLNACLFSTSTCVQPTKIAESDKSYLCSTNATKFILYREKNVTIDARNNQFLTWTLSFTKLGPFNYSEPVQHRTMSALIFDKTYRGFGMPASISSPSLKKFGYYVAQDVQFAIDADSRREPTKVLIPEFKIGTTNPVVIPGGEANCIPQN